MKRTKIAVAVALSSLALSAAARDARAESPIKTPGDHPSYVVELEPHGLFGTDGPFSTGVGVGGRFSIPIIDNGFVKSINNSIAIGAGLDVFFLNGCYYTSRAGNECGETAFDIPLVMQWNFYVARQVSVFGEPGVAFRHRSFTGCPPGVGCNEPDSNLFAPFIFYAGGRYHFNEHVAIIGRIGVDWYGAAYFSVGASFFL
jgi:hypothetical protein